MSNCWKRIGAGWLSEERVTKAKGADDFGNGGDGDGEGQPEPRFENRFKCEVDSKEDEEPNSPAIHEDES